MLKVYLKAFVDQNFGDDLMIMRLLSYFPNIDFYLYCSEDKQFFYRQLLAGYPHCKLTNVELYQVAINYPANFFGYIILLGGSVLQGSRNAGIFYRSRNIAALKSLASQGLKYLIIGCNIGPFINHHTENAVKSEIACADLLIARDQASYKYAQKIIGNKAYLASDILWHSIYNIPPQIAKYGLGIALLSSKNAAQNSQYAHFFINLADNYIKHSQEKLAFLALSSSPNSDLQLAELIKQKAQHPQMIDLIYHHSEDALQIIKAIKQCRQIMAIRFHAMIIALNQSIPVLPIYYSNKGANFGSDLGFSHQMINLNDLLAKDSRQIMQLIDNRQNYINIKKPLKLNDPLAILADYFCLDNFGNR